MDVKISIAIQTLTQLSIFCQTQHQQEMLLRQGYRALRVMGSRNMDRSVLYLFLKSNTLNIHIYSHSQYITTYHLNSQTYTYINHLPAQYTDTHSTTVYCRILCTTLEPCIYRQ